MEAAYEPKTLQEAIIHFADPDNCLKYLAAKRWPNGVTCPTCGSQNVIFLANQRRWKCHETHPLQQFSVKVGTVMEDSPIPLGKWLMAMWQIVNCKNGISSYEVHRAIGITQKSAWFMDHRIRYALGLGLANKFSGQIEADKCVFRAMPITVPRPWRSRFRTDADHDSEMMAIAIISES